MSAIRPFHLAIPVHDLEIAREFYGDILGCSTGRESENWIDFNFFGHQLVTHLDKSMNISDFTNTTIFHENFAIKLKHSYNC